MLPVPSAGRTGRGAEETPAAPPGFVTACREHLHPLRAAKVPADSQGSADTPRGTAPRPQHRTRWGSSELCQPGERGGTQPAVPGSTGGDAARSPGERSGGQCPQPRGAQGGTQPAAPGAQGERAKESVSQRITETRLRRTFRHSGFTVGTGACSRATREIPNARRHGCDTTSS